MVESIYELSRHCPINYIHSTLYRCVNITMLPVNMQLEIEWKRKLQFAVLRLNISSIDNVTVYCYSKILLLNSIHFRLLKIISMNIIFYLFCSIVWCSFEWKIGRRFFLDNQFFVSKSFILSQTDGAKKHFSYPFKNKKPLNLMSMNVTFSFVCNQQVS